MCHSSFSFNFSNLFFLPRFSFPLFLKFIQSRPPYGTFSCLLIWIWIFFWDYYCCCCCFGLVLICFEIKRRKRQRVTPTDGRPNMPSIHLIRRVFIFKLSIQSYRWAPRFEYHFGWMIRAGRPADRPSSRPSLFEIKIGDQTLVGYI